MSCVGPCSFGWLLFRSVSLRLSDRWKCHQIFATSVPVELCLYSSANLQDKEQLLFSIGVNLSMGDPNARPAFRIWPTAVFSLFSNYKTCPCSLSKIFLNYLKCFYVTGVKARKGLQSSAASFLLLPDAELPLVESFGLLNNLFPFPSILDAGYPVLDLQLANVLLDVILPSVLGSSL